MSWTRNCLRELFRAEAIYRFSRLHAMPWQANVFSPLQHAFASDNPRPCAYPLTRSLRRSVLRGL